MLSVWYDILMKITVDDLNKQVIAYLVANKLTHRDAQVLAKVLIEQEMLGNQFSAIGELAGKHARLIQNITAGQEEVVSEKAAMKLLKGNGRLAPLITADYLDEVVARAKNQGIYAMGIYDSTYNDFFDVFCRRIVAQNCIAIFFEKGGPKTVVPFGGKTSITGTNPLAYGIPTHTDPIIFDASTAQHAYGRIRQAKTEGSLLPDNAYVDENGEVTTDPWRAAAILPFGGFKGFAVNLLVDVLSGCLVRGRSGLDQTLDTQRYIGTFFIVIDPSSFSDIVDFKDATTKLAGDILAIKPVDPKKPVRVPGMRGAMRKRQFEVSGFIDIEDKDWRRFSRACSDLNIY